MLTCVLTLGPDFPLDGSPLPSAASLLPPQAIACLTAASIPPAAAAAQRLPCRSQPLCVRVATGVPLPASGLLAPALGPPIASLGWAQDPDVLADRLVVNVTCPRLDPITLAAYAGGVVVEFAAVGGAFAAVPTLPVLRGSSTLGRDGCDLLLSAEALLNLVGADVGVPTAFEFRVAAATGRGPRQLGLRSNRIVLVVPDPQPRPVSTSPQT